MSQPVQIYAATRCEDPDLLVPAIWYYFWTANTLNTTTEMRASLLASCKSALQAAFYRVLFLTNVQSSSSPTRDQAVQHGTA